MPGRLRGSPRGAGERRVARARDGGRHRPGDRGRDGPAQLRVAEEPGEHILFQNVRKEGSTSIGVYEASGGDAKLGEWLRMAPEAIIDVVKKSNLRGRGGAGFPTGMKWGFLPRDNPKPRYMCVNADEREPGTYKDRLILERDPHRLIEAIVVLPRHPLADGLHLHPRRVPRRRADPGESTRGGAGEGLRREERARHRGGRRDPRAPRGGLLRVRRGDGAHRVARGQARPAPHRSRPSRRWWASTAAPRSSTTSRPS